MERANDCLTQFLHRGWQKRALVWAGQSEADHSQALRLSEARNSPGIPTAPQSLPSALEFAILEFGQYPKRYEELFLARGADSLEVAPGDPSKLKVLCASLSPDTLAETLQALQSVIEKSEIDLVRLDAKSQPVATKAATRLQQWGSTPETFPLCG